MNVMENGGEVVVGAGNGMRRYECAFGSGVSCRVMVGTERPTTGTAQIRVTEWTGKPNRAMLRSYVQWMNSVNESLSTEWGISMMQVFLVDRHKVEIWAYKPGQAAELLEEWPG